MNRTWQIILAIIAFLACTFVGAAGGCTVGFFSAISLSSGGRHPNSGNPDALFFVLLGAGAIGGLVIGVIVARLILKPPRPPQ